MSSSQHDPRAYLWDARQAARSAQGFLTGRARADYADDEMFRFALERQFITIGEALNKLRRLAPELASQVPGLHQIVGLRNVLVHGYATVDDDLVWAAATEELQGLIDAVDELLDDGG